MWELKQVVPPTLQKKKKTSVTQSRSKDYKVVIETPKNTTKITSGGTSSGPATRSCSEDEVAGGLDCISQLQQQQQKHKRKHNDAEDNKQRGRTQLQVAEISQHFKEQYNFFETAAKTKARIGSWLCHLRKCWSGLAAGLVDN